MDGIGMKACPFCGNEKLQVADNVALGWLETVIEAYAFTVICSEVVGGCGATSGFRGTEEDAIAAWQKRVGWDEDR